MHSTAYLDKSANEWVQRQMTESLGDRVITTHPYAIVYDPKHDTVVVALGLQGVVVGTPDGDWRPVAVGPYSPTDFSVATRFGLLFSHPNLWISVVAVSVSVVAGTVALRRFRAEGGGRHQTPAFVFSAGVLTLSPVGMGIGSLLMVVVTGMVVSIYRFVAHRGTIRRFWEVVVLVIWTTLGSGLFVAILVYGFPVFIYAIFGFGVYFWWWYAVTVAATAGAAGGLLWLWLGSRFWLVLAGSSALAALILAVVFGPYFGIFGIGAARHYSVGYTAFFMGPALSYAVLALALSWHVFRWWPVIIVAFLSINAVILGGVTLWMWNNVTLLPFQPLASGLTALIAWALWRYLRAKQPSPIKGEGVLRQAQDERRWAGWTGFWAAAGTGIATTTRLPRYARNDRRRVVSRFRGKDGGDAPHNYWGGVHPRHGIKYGAGSSPLPSRERGSFDRLRTNGGGRDGQDFGPREATSLLRRRDCRATLAMTGVG